MNKKFLETLLKWPKSYLTGTNLTIALGKSPHSRQGIIKRALAEGALLRLRRDLYLIKIQYDQAPVDRFELAPIIYGPSYVSMESALAYHGWIPEGVPVTTCGTTKRTKEFETPIGLFSYHHIPVSAFSMGAGLTSPNRADMEG